MCNNVNVKEVCVVCVKQVQVQAMGDGSGVDRSRVQIRTLYECRYVGSVGIGKLDVLCYMQVYQDSKCKVKINRLASFIGSNFQLRKLKIAQ